MSLPRNANSLIEQVLKHCNRLNLNSVVTYFPKDSFLGDYDANVIQGSHIIAGTGPRAYGGDTVNKFTDILFNQEMPVSNVISVGDDYIDYCQMTPSRAQEFGCKLEYTSQEETRETLHRDVVKKHMVFTKNSTGEGKRIDVTNIALNRVNFLNITDLTKSRLTPEEMQKKLDAVWDVVKLAQQENVVVHCGFGINRTGFFVLFLEFLRHYDKIFKSRNPGIIAYEIKNVIDNIRASRSVLVTDHDQVKEALLSAYVMHQYALEKKLPFEFNAPESPSKRQKIVSTKQMTAVMKPAAPAPDAGIRLIDEVIRNVTFKRPGGPEPERDAFIKAHKYNANVIKGTHLIAAHGPDNTMRNDRFIGMLCNTAIPISKVVALDLDYADYLKDGKEFDYYSVKEKASVKYNGDFGVKTMKYLERASYTEKEVQVAFFNIVGMDFLNISDQVYSDEARNVMVNKLNLLLDIYKSSLEENILIHCNFGEGRTGAFVLMLEIMREYDRIFASGNPKEIAKECEIVLARIRQSRPYLVTKVEQFHAAIRSAYVLHQYALRKTVQLVQRDNPIPRVRQAPAPVRIPAPRVPVVRKPSVMFAPFTAYAPVAPVVPAEPLSLVEQVASLVRVNYAFGGAENTKPAFLNGYDANLISGSRIIAGGGPDEFMGSWKSPAAFINILFNKEMPVENVIALQKSTGASYYNYCKENVYDDKSILACKFSAKVAAKEQLHKTISKTTMQYENGPAGAETKTVNVYGLTCDHVSYLEIKGVPQTPEARELREKKLDVLWDLSQLVQRENVFIHCDQGIMRTAFLVLTMELIREHERLFASGKPDVIAKEIEGLVTRVRHSRPAFSISLYDVQEAIRSADIIYQHGMEKQLRNDVYTKLYI